MEIGLYSYSALCSDCLASSSFISSSYILILHCVLCISPTSEESTYMENSIRPYRISTFALVPCRNKTSPRRLSSATSLCRARMRSLHQPTPAWLHRLNTFKFRTPLNSLKFVSATITPLLLNASHDTVCKMRFHKTLQHSGQCCPFPFPPTQFRNLGNVTEFL